MKEKLTEVHTRMLVEIFGEDELHVVNQMDHATLVESLLHARNAISLLRGILREKRGHKELGSK